MTAKVRQVDLPPSARELSTLPRIDYSDAFLFDAVSTRDVSAEDLMREVLEGAPVAVRTQLLSGWSAIGLKVRIGSERSVLGWEIRRAAPDHVLLGADSRIGMPGELISRRKTAHCFSRHSWRSGICSPGRYGPSPNPRMFGSCATCWARRVGGSAPESGRGRGRQRRAGSGATGGAASAGPGAVRVRPGHPGGGAAFALMGRCVRSSSASLPLTSCVWYGVPESRR